jgi:hypothetical protein
MDSRLPRLNDHSKPIAFFHGSDAPHLSVTIPPCFENRQGNEDPDTLEGYRVRRGGRLLSSMIETKHGICRRRHFWEIDADEV